MSVVSRSVNQFDRSSWDLLVGCKCSPHLNIKLNNFTVMCPAARLLCTFTSPFIGYNAPRKHKTLLFLRNSIKWPNNSNTAINTTYSSFLVMFWVSDVYIRSLGQWCYRKIFKGGRVKFEMESLILEYIETILVILY